MNIAINPAIPEYRAVIKLKPVEEPDMKVRSYIKEKPLITSAWPLMIGWALLAAIHYMF